MRHETIRIFFLLAVVVPALSACRPAEPEPEPVRSYLEGRFTVDPEIDPTPDYRDFEVLVAAPDSAGTDTLGFATTDSTGAFRMAIEAPDRGIYPFYVSRRGVTLYAGELAVAEGDSATVTAQFPVDNRLLRVRSAENAAWMAYRNSKAQYNNALVRMLQEGAYGDAEMRRNVNQAATILWSLRETFPGTIGADIAAAESVVMLDGWNDSLLVARAREITPANPSFVDVGRAARRAQARLGGQAAALELVRAFQEKTDDAEQKAGLQSEVVVAYSDSLQREEALDAARTLKQTYADTPWASWADRAIYEIEHLSPGMPAPGFELTAREGQPVRLDRLKDRYVVLEFYHPQEETYQRQLATRNALHDAVGRDTLAFVSISVLPDTLLNDAFAEGRIFPGIHVIAPEGLQSDVARAYNVNTVPTRVLVDREGRIVRKYVGNTLARLQEDLIALLREEQPPA